MSFEKYMAEFTYKDYKLRKAIMTDAAALYEITHDKAVMEYHGESGAWLENIEAAEAELKWGLNLFADNAGRWIIVNKVDNVYIGDIGFFGFSPKHKKVELGYKLKKEYWGQGIISAFIGLLLDYGFTELGYNRIQAYVDPRNIGSQRVLLKNHFVKEGTLREYEFEDTAFVDLEIYSILKKDHVSQHEF
jgi:ribosomal-protein-alanine N-acetyltransferase